MKFSSEQYKEFNREKMKTLVNPTRLRKTSTVKSQPGASAAPTPGVPGVSNGQGASAVAPQNNELPNIVMESDSEEEEEEGASSQPNPAVEGQLQGGTPNPAGEGQTQGNAPTPPGAA